MKKITDGELLEVFKEFDDSLDLDEQKIAALPAKQKGELFISIQKVLEYRKDFPPDLSFAVQQLAKQSVEKNPDQDGIISLDADSDGLVLESGEIILPDDELFPLAKKLSTMSSQEIGDYIDDVAKLVSQCCELTAVQLMKKSLSQIEEKIAVIEEKRGMKSDGQGSKDEGKWKTFTNQM